MLWCRRLLGGCAATAVVACLVPAGAAGQEIDDSYIVVYERAISDPSAETAARERQLGFDSSRRFRRAIEGFAATLTPEQVSRLREDPEVAHVTPNRRVRATGFVPLVSGDTTPFGVRRMLAGTTTTAREASGANVAVIDTGIDLDHPDLNVADGTDCISPGTPAEDDDGHGTHVAGSIAARNNGTGVVGVAPGTKTYAVKVLNSNGEGSTASVICGIDWVAANAASLGIKVSNMSLGGVSDAVGSCGSTSDPQHQAICNATAAGVHFVVAAGNSAYDFDFASEPDVPASYPQVLTVTAMSDSDGLPGATGGGPSCWSDQPDDGPADFSNFAATEAGAAHTIAAPGVCINSTVPGGGYGLSSGTSMASPHMAGIVALCIAEGGSGGPCASLTPAQVITYLRAQAQSYNQANPDYGFAGDADNQTGSFYFGHLQGPLDELGAPPPGPGGQGGGENTPVGTDTTAATPLTRPALAKADLSRARGSIKVRRGRFTYSFGGPPGAAGEAAFRSIAKVKVSVRRKVTLARKSFRVRNSGRVTLRIKLSRKNLRILRRNRRIKLRVAVRLENAAGQTSRATRTLTLRI